MSDAHVEVIVQAPAVVEVTQSVPPVVNVEVIAGGGGAGGIGVGPGLTIVGDEIRYDIESLTRG